jgi:hypothetical protein
MNVLQSSGFLSVSAASKQVAFYTGCWQEHDGIIIMMMPPSRLCKYMCCCSKTLWQLLHCWLLGWAVLVVVSLI